MGTELQRQGLPPGSAGESWNVTDPDRVEAIHRAYLKAGSDLVLTNSFGANPWVLGRYGLDEEFEAINREAARTARRAAGDLFVLGDIGPCGGFLVPLGEVRRDRLADAFERQAAALLEGGADAILVETMSALDEAVIAVKAARAAGAPFVGASMTFDSLPNGRVRTMMGEEPERAATALAEAGADMIGANCGTRMTIADYSALTELFRSAVSLPIIIQPNAGQPELVDGVPVYRLAPADFASAMLSVLEAGASVVGGCCGTTPAHVAALRAVVDRWLAGKK